MKKGLLRQKEYNSAVTWRRIHRALALLSLMGGGVGGYYFSKSAQSEQLEQVVTLDSSPAVGGSPFDRAVNPPDKKPETKPIIKPVTGETVGGEDPVEVPQPLIIVPTAADLRAALDKGDVEAVTKMVHDGVVMPTEKADQEALAKAAAQHGMVSILAALKKGGMSFDDASAEPLLREALMHNHADAVLWFLDQGLSEEKVMHNAAAYGAVDVMEALKERDADAVNRVNERGNPPLYSAILNGSTPAALWLIKNGADLSFRTENGARPIHSAAVRGRLDVLEAIRDSGCPDEIFTEPGGQSGALWATPRWYLASYRSGGQGPFDEATLARINALIAFFKSKEPVDLDA